MRRLAWFLSCAAGLLPTPQSPAPAAQHDAFAFVRALDDAAGRKVWPGFNPSSLPIALFDGENTILLRHPSPPPEFSPMSGHPGVLIAPGRYPAVVSNSTRDIGGVRTATTNPHFTRGTFGGSAGLTVPAGRHPLRDGIRQLTIVGIEGAPTIGRDGQMVTLEAPGVRLTLRGVDMRVDGDLVRITVR